MSACKYCGGLVPRYYNYCPPGYGCDLAPIDARGNPVVPGKQYDRVEHALNPDNPKPIRTVLLQVTATKSGGTKEGVSVDWSRCVPTPETTKGT